MATTVGSPFHRWPDRLLGRPTRSAKLWAPSFENPTPVRDPLRVVGFATRKPVASFQAARTRVPSAAMAVSLWPAARSSFGSAASTLFPNATEAGALRPAAGLVCGPRNHALAPWDSIRASRILIAPRWTDDDAAGLAEKTETIPMMKRHDDNATSFFTGPPCPPMPGNLPASEVVSPAEDPGQGCGCSRRKERQSGPGWLTASQHSFRLPANMQTRAKVVFENSEKAPAG